MNDLHNKYNNTTTSNARWNKAGGKNYYRMIMNDIITANATL